MPFGNVPTHSYHPPTGLPSRRRALICGCNYRSATCHLCTSSSINSPVINVVLLVSCCVGCLFGLGRLACIRDPTFFLVCSHGKGSKVSIALKLTVCKEVTQFCCKQSHLVYAHHNVTHTVVYGSHCGGQYAFKLLQVWKQVVIAGAKPKSSNR